MPELRRRTAVNIGSDLISRPWAIPTVEQARAEKPRQKSAKEMQAEHQHRLDQRPLTVACGFCDWMWHGPAGDARAAAKAHRLEWHPQPKRRGRRGDGFSRWSRKGPTPEQEAEAVARRLIHEKAAKRNP